MADNTTLNAGTGGDVIRAEEKGGVKTQVMLIDIGGTGAESLVDGTNPLPVTVGNFPATQAISAASLPLPSGAATDATLAAMSGKLPATLGQKAGTGSLSVILASDQPALGVTVGNFPATQAISAASLPLPSGAATAANQTSGNAILTAISGQLPATLGQKAMAASLPVTLASDQSALPVTVGNFPATQAISAAALPLPSGAATETTLASLVTAGADATASGNITTQNLVSAGAATTGSAVAITPGGRSGLIVQVTGTYTGALSLQGMVDGSTWVTIGGAPFKNVNTGATSATIASGTQGIFQAEASGFAQVRVTGLAAMTGTAVVTMRATASTAMVALDAALPTGANTIGNLVRQSGFSDTSTALAANATFTGTGRATTGGNWTKFAANVFADQAGTLFIDLSVDSGTTYRTIKSVAVTAGTAAELVANVTGAAGTATLYRVRYTNGATLQGAFQLSSAFLA